MKHHAFVVEAEAEEGIDVARAWAERELEMRAEGNPDFAIMRYGLFSVADARRVSELAMGAPFAGEHRVLIITVSRAYHEAQNTLLKLFEEPPQGMYVFLVMPSLGGLLPTLRSRVQVLKHQAPSTKSQTSAKRALSPNPWRSGETNLAEEFIKADKEKRTALIKKLVSGRDEEERRKNREQAIAIVNGIEAVVYASRESQTFTAQKIALFSDIAILRGYFYDRSAPVRMILEHFSIVTPKNLL